MGDAYLPQPQIIVLFMPLIMPGHYIEWRGSQPRLCKRHQGQGQGQLVWMVFLARDPRSPFTVPSYLTHPQGATPNTCPTPLLLQVVPHFITPLPCWWVMSQLPDQA